jgi:hypothetical protein
MTTDWRPARYIFNELFEDIRHGQEAIGRGYKETIACGATAAQGEKGCRSRTQSGGGPANLLLPTISTPEPISKLDVHETMHTSPDNRIARWGIIGARKITAELRELDETA